LKLSNYSAMRSGFMPIPRSSLCVCAALFVAISGCRDREITAYRVPKEKSAPPSPRPASSAMPIAPGIATSSDQAAPQWDVPPGWEAQALSGPRIGSFAIKAPDGRTAEVAVTSFGGSVGGDLANVNRWRGQINLPPIAATDLTASVKTIDLPAGSFQLVDLVSEEPIIEGKFKSRIVGAWLKQPEQVWFFKLSGEADLVDSQRESFLAFLRSVSFGVKSGAAVSTNTAHMPTAAAVAPSGGDGTLNWAVPATWLPKPPAPMRKASYTVSSDAGEADFSISSFGGAAGGLEGNLNRWRNQLQLPPLSAAELASQSSVVANGPLRFTVVDYAGQMQAGPSRILGAVLPLENETYFFKMTGPDAAVAAQKSAFIEFLKTVKTP
jgi:hypothetical protein